MKQNDKKRFEKFCDGVLQLIAAGEQNPYLSVNFEYYKIGIKRYYSALASGENISECVKVQQIRNKIDGTETVVIGDRRFFIVQIQHCNETSPKTTVLTLREK